MRSSCTEREEEEDRSYDSREWALMMSTDELKNARTSIPYPLGMDRRPVVGMGVGGH